MVKSLEPQTNKSSPRLKLPINLIIFWYKRLSNIINSKKFEATNKDNCPKIYISKRFPQMSVLELYQRVNHHLNKYYPNIHQKLNMNNNKKHIIKLRKIKTKKKISENTENEKLKNLTDKNNSEENIIKSTNEKYCGKISHLFEEHKFDKEVYEKYNNCSVKEILIKNDNNITDTNTKGLDSISPSKSTTSSTKSYGSKITYLTHSKFNNYKKSKYFNNDEYYIKKLSEMETQKNTSKVEKQK